MTMTDNADAMTEDEVVLIPALTVSQKILDDIADITPRVAAVVKDLHVLGLAMGPIAEWVNAFGRGRDLDDELENAIRTTGYYELRDLWERAETIAKGTTGSRIQPGLLYWNDASWRKIDDEALAQDPADALTEYGAEMIRRQQERIRARRREEQGLESNADEGTYDGDE